MEHLVPPPKRRIGEDSMVCITKPIGRDVTEQKLTTFGNQIEEQLKEKEKEHERQAMDIEE